MPQQAALSIYFLIVGGGIAGLTSAFALGRAGHKVVVLEKGTGIYDDRLTGGLRVPPNMSKILNHWGLEEKLGKIATHTDAITFLSTEKGELLGRHTWSEELIKESGGHFNVTHHAGMMRFLQKLAKCAGAEIRYNAPVKSIDPDNRKVTLSSGEILRPDVIVGADGVQGSTRSHLLQGPNKATVRFVMYSTTVSRRLMKQDPELVYFCDQSARQYCWFGGRVHVIAWPTGTAEGNNDLAMYIYCPPDGHEGELWEDFASHEQLITAMKDCEPRLRKLARMGTRPRCVQVKECPALEDWVHDSGRMVLVGDAAHPTRPGGVQTCAMAFEDGAVLGKLFSHLRTEDQIATFLWAFEDLRQPRCAAVISDEIHQLLFSCLPPGQDRDNRDTEMKTRERAGRNVMEPPEDDDDAKTSTRWETVKFLFDYDAEDAADNWWVQWGLLRERAKGVEVQLPRLKVISEIVDRAYVTRSRRP